jgi:hypothetical protein
VSWRYLAFLDKYPHLSSSGVTLPKPFADRIRIGVIKRIIDANDFALLPLINRI